MSIKQYVRHTGLSLIVVSALLSGCDDEGDNSDDPSQEGEGDSGATNSTGSSSTRAGRSGGSAGSTSGGRGGAGSVARGGAGGRDSAETGGRRSVPRDEEGGSGGSGGRRATLPGAGGSGGSGGTGGTVDLEDAGVDTISLNDGQIAEITNVVNTGEIALGMLALTRAQLPATRDYAQSMVSMHQSAQERQTALVTAVGLTPSPSSISSQLTDDAVRVRNQLESAADAEVDVLYIRSQVELHANVLETIDEQLLPNVSAEMLREELVVTRVMVAAHLETAQALLVTLEAVDGSDAGVP